MSQRRAKQAFFFAVQQLGGGSEACRYPFSNPPLRICPGEARCRTAEFLHQWLFWALALKSSPRCDLLSGVERQLRASTWADSPAIVCWGWLQPPDFCQIQLFQSLASTSVTQRCLAAAIDLQERGATNPLKAIWLFLTVIKVQQPVLVLEFKM